MKNGVKSALDPCCLIGQDLRGYRSLRIKKKTLKQQKIDYLWVKGRLDPLSVTYIHEKLRGRMGVRPTHFTYIHEKLWNK